MAYVTVPKDLTAVKTKVLFNLTKRQLTCFSSGVTVGACVYYACIAVTDSSNALTLMMLTMFPFFLLAMYEKNGQPLEVILTQMYLVKFATAKERPYRTANLYALLEQQYDIEHKEVTEIAQSFRSQKDPRTNQSTKQSSVEGE